MSDFPVEKPEQYLILYIATLIQLSECLDIKPPSNASPPPTIKPVPKCSSNNTYSCRNSN